MNPEDKKILTEAISEGIENGLWKLIGQILSGIAIGVVIFGVVWIGMILYSNYNQEQCIESGKCQEIVGVSQPSELQYKYKLDCGLFVGNATIQREVYVFGAEDYIDANAKLEQIKLFITNTNNSISIMGDKLEGNTSDWKLIGINCK